MEVTKNPTSELLAPGFVVFYEVSVMKKAEDFIYGRDNVLKDENVCLLMKIGEVARR